MLEISQETLNTLISHISKRLDNHFVAIQQNEINLEFYLIERRENTKRRGIQNLIIDGNYYSLDRVVLKSNSLDELLDYIKFW
jgi:hypothetical protein